MHVAWRTKFKFPSQTQEYSHERPSDVSWSFLQSSMCFLILILLLGLSTFSILFYLTLLSFDPCWPPKPHTFSFSSNLCASLTAGSRVVISSPEQPPEVLWDGQWDFSLPTFLHLMDVWWAPLGCFKPCGQGMSLPCVNGTTLLLFPMGSLSVLPTGTCGWKTILWSTSKEVTF